MAIRMMSCFVLVLFLFVAGCENDDGTSVGTMMPPGETVLHGDWGIGTFFIVEVRDTGESPFKLRTTVMERREYNEREIAVFEFTSGDAQVPQEIGGEGSWGTYFYDVETGNFVAEWQKGILQREVRPHDGRLNFPMEVGKTWRSEYFSVTYGNRTSGIVWFDYEVLSYEEIKLKAGTFMAYKIAVNDAAFDLNVNEVFWYVPDVMGVLKSVSDVSEFELVEYFIETTQ